MPKARAPLPPVLPAPIRPLEVRFIVATVKRFYGTNAVIRNFGPDPARLWLHVETDMKPGLERDDCLGVLMCRIKRDEIRLVATRRGHRIVGEAKIAYRQGEILRQ
jgi:hypothetical protein